MKYFALIVLLICLFSTVNCLQCNSNTTDTICNDPYCFVILTVSGSEPNASYLQLEGCGSVLHEDPILKSLNLTCQDNVTQSINTSFSNVPFIGKLYCCKTDFCNTQIPGFVIPTHIIPTVPPTTTNTNTSTAPTITNTQTSTSSTITPPSSTITNDGITVTPPLKFFMAFILITFMILK